MGWTDPLDFGHLEAFPELRDASLFIPRVPLVRSLLLSLNLTSHHLTHTTTPLHPRRKHAQVTSHFVPRVGAGGGAEVDLDTKSDAHTHTHTCSYPYAGHRSECCADAVRSM